MESTMQMKSFFNYALAVGIVGALAVASASPSFARQARKATQMGSYQLQSAESSYAYAYESRRGVPGRGGQCWIATDANRPFGYMDSCANPLAYDPALDPTYDGTLHGSD
jgi:hypothetical protein